MGKETIANKIQSAGNAINSALNNEEVLEMLSRYGYGREKLLEGQALWEKTKEMVTFQTKEYGDQYSQKAEVERLFGEYYPQYMVYLKLARIAFQDNHGFLYSLRATGKRNRSYSGWLKDARAFYGNLSANSEALGKIAAFGVTTMDISAGLDNVNRFETAYQTYLTEMGEAQQSTKDRDKVIDELSSWFSDFRAVARIALYEKPQLLETLGIFVRS
jgi:hypothetical protein